MDYQNDEDQSPVHIMREHLDIGIRLGSPMSETPKTFSKVKTSEHIDYDQDTTPKTQIDVFSPRIPFLTHSEMIGMNSEIELEYSRSNLNVRLDDVVEAQEENTPSLKASTPGEFAIENLSITQSQLKASKKQQQRQIEIQLEYEYKITSLQESFQEKEESYKRILAYKKQDEINIVSKINQIVRLFDNKLNVSELNIHEILQIIHQKMREKLLTEEEEKMDDHKHLINNLNNEIAEVKNLRYQLQKIYKDYEQFKFQDLSKVNELNLQILDLKQEKLQLQEQNAQLTHQIQMIMNENSQRTDTMRKSSSMFRSMDLDSIKEELKKKQQQQLKKTLKVQNSPSSKSQNHSPVIKFLASPSSQHTRNNSKNVSDDLIFTPCFIQNFIDQFRGTSTLSGRIQNLTKS